MSKNLWLAALASLALAGAPALAQTGSQQDSGSAGVTGQQGSSDQGAYQGGSIGAGQQQGATGQQGQFGQEQQGSSAGQARQPGSTFASNQLTGKIQNVDKSAKELTIAQPDGTQQSLKLGQNATVFMQGKLGSIQDLKEGQQVRAAYENQNGQKTLRWIEVTPNQQGEAAPQGQQTQPAPQGQQNQGVQPGAQDQDQGVQPGAQDNDQDQGGGSDVGSSGAKAQDQGTMGQAGSTQGEHEIFGQVVNVKPDKNEVVLQHRGKQLTLNVPDSAKIMVDGKKASLSDLKEGQEVRAALEANQQGKSGESMKASRLEVLPKGQKGFQGQPGSQQQGEGYHQSGSHGASDQNF